MFQKSVNNVENRYVRSNLFLGTLLGLILFGCQPKQNIETAPESPAFDEEKETAAIMAVIKNETSSFLMETMSHGLKTGHIANTLFKPGTTAMVHRMLQ